MIILEGADHTGKTTFAQKICEILATRLGGSPSSYYGHMTRPSDDFDHVVGYMSQVTSRCQDRFHLGSIVYGYILCGGSFTTPRKMRVVQQYLRWRGCITVIMSCERDKLRKRLASAVDRKEMYSNDKILDANEAFRGLAFSTNSGVMYADHHIDVTDKWPDEDKATEIIDDWWKKFMS